MMALRARTRGGPDQLVYERAPVPAPAPGEALMAVYAAGITFAVLSWDLPWTTRGRTPVVSQVFPLSEGRRAHERGRQPRAPGKTVLTV